MHSQNASTEQHNILLPDTVENAASRVHITTTSTAALTGSQAFFSYTDTTKQATIFSSLYVTDKSFFNDHNH